MTDGSAGPGDVTPQDPFAAPSGRPGPPLPPPPPPFPPPAPLVPPPAPPAAVGDPNRHFDGQQWLVWNGMAWVPEPPLTPPKSGSRRTLVVVVAIIVLGLLAGATVLGLHVANANKAIVIPVSLGGLDKSTDAQITAQADQLRTQLGSSIHGASFDVGAYGSQDAGAVAVLVAARNGGTADAFFGGVKSSGLDISERTTIGDDQCVTGGGDQLTVCMRSTSGLIVAVLLSGTDENKAAAMVDEAWAQE